MHYLTTIVLLFLSLSISAQSTQEINELTTSNEVLTVVIPSNTTVKAVNIKGSRLQINQSITLDISLNALNYVIANNRYTCVKQHDQETQSTRIIFNSVKPLLVKNTERTEKREITLYIPSTVKTVKYIYQ